MVSVWGGISPLLKQMSYSCGILEAHLFGESLSKSERNYRLTLLSVIGVSLTLSLMSMCLHDVDVDQPLYS